VKRSPFKQLADDLGVVLGRLKVSVAAADEIVRAAQTYLQDKTPPAFYRGNYKSYHTFLVEITKQADGLSLSLNRGISGFSPAAASDLQKRLNALTAVTRLVTDAIQPNLKGKPADYWRHALDDAIADVLERHGAKLAGGISGNLAQVLECVYPAVGIGSGDTHRSVRRVLDQRKRDKAIQDRLSAIKSRQNP
jgi:hypothetical protein